MEDFEDTLSEIKVDVKRIQHDLNELGNSLVRIESVVPSRDKVQNLEVKMTSLQTQFRVVWAALGAVGLATLGSIIAQIMKMVGLS